MTKYDPLRDYLSNRKGNELTRTFKEIDNMITQEPRFAPFVSLYNQGKCF